MIRPIALEDKATFPEGMNGARVADRGVDRDPLPTQGIAHVARQGPNSVKSEPTPLELGSQHDVEPSLVR